MWFFRLFVDYICIMFSVWVFSISIVMLIDFRKVEIIIFVSISFRGVVLLCLVEFSR